MLLRRTLVTLTLMTLVLFTSAASATDTQRDNPLAGGIQIPVAQPLANAPEPGGQVFVPYAGFYDPYWAWGPWGPYGYGYYYDFRPQLRVKVRPEEPGDSAAVYVDGAYAGEADKFDGQDQGFGFSEGPHTVVVYLEGYKTARFSVNLREGETFKIRHTLEPLAPGEVSEPPEVATATTGSTRGSYPARRMR